MFREILEKNPTPQAYVMLGDAFMSIQEVLIVKINKYNSQMFKPTNAIDAFETAMRRNPKDFELAVKIGDAYVKCHLYNKVSLLLQTVLIYSVFCLLNVLMF